VRAVRAVKQNYSPSEPILVLLESFRSMVNDCIGIGLKEGVTSLKALSPKAYRQLHEYDVPSYYKICAISATTGILRNHRKASRKNACAKTPHARRLMLTTCYGFKIKDGCLRLPIKPREFTSIPLNSHTQEVLSGPGLTMRSVCLTARTVSITFSKEMAEMEPVGLIGLDRNLDNATIATSGGDVRRYDLSEATRIRAVYREVKAHFTRDDVRVRRRIFAKYGRKERNRTTQILHHTSKEIVSEAKAKRFSIAMEKLTGMRKLYRKGNDQGRWFRARMNSWSFSELQRQIEYKARWEGIKVTYVDPRKTSSTCAVCGRATTECAERKVWCAQCRTLVDRDVNGARNILARGMRFVPIALPGEGMKQSKDADSMAAELTQRQ